MNANELRLGNLVNHTNKNGSFDLSVIEILEKGVNVTKKIQLGEWFLRIDEIQGIPLTGDVLLILGFKKIFDSYYLNSKHFDFGFTRGRFYIKCKGNNIPTNILYAHQVQNLFFSLTGSEIKNYNSLGK